MSLLLGKLVWAFSTSDWLWWEHINGDIEGDIGDDMRMIREVTYEFHRGGW